MPTKVRLIKLLEEIHGVGQTPLRRTTLKPALLYLMALRDRVGTAAPTKKKLVVSVNLPENLETACPIKITHLPAGETPAPGRHHQE